MSPIAYGGEGDRAQGSSVALSPWSQQRMVAGLGQVTAIDRHELPIPTVMTTHRSTQQRPTEPRWSPVTYLPRAPQGDREGSLISEAQALAILSWLINPSLLYIKSEYRYSIIDGLLYRDHYSADKVLFAEIRRHPYPYEKFWNRNRGFVAFFPVYKLLNMIEACFMYGTDVLIMHTWQDEGNDRPETIAVHSAWALFTAWWDSWYRLKGETRRKPFDFSSAPPEGVVWSPFHPNPDWKHESDVLHYNPMGAYWGSMWTRTEAGYQLMDGSPDIVTPEHTLFLPNSGNQRNIVECQQALGIKDDQNWPNVVLPPGAHPEGLSDKKQLSMWAKPTSLERQNPIGLFWNDGSIKYQGTHPTVQISDIQTMRAHMRNLSTFPSSDLGRGELDPVVRQCQFRQSEAA